MSTDPQDPLDVPPVTPEVVIVPKSGTTAAAAAEDTAERFLLREVSEARRSLRLTQIIGSLVALGTIGYLSYVTINLNRALEPEAAAEIATGVLQERVDVHGAELAAEFKQRIPAMVADLPDYALQQMPLYREQLEDQIEADLTRHVAATTQELDGHIDDFLGANKDQINALLEDGQDPEKMRELVEALQSEVVEYLNEAKVGGETLTAKVAHTLEALQRVEKRMDRLANARDLTEQEKKARRAIAILAQNIEQKRAADGSSADGGI